MVTKRLVSKLPTTFPQEKGVYRRSVVKAPSGSSDGGWITIGGEGCHPGSGSHCGGTHVFIRDGKITAGPAALTGQSISDLKHPKKPKNELNPVHAPKGDEESTNLGVTSTPELEGKPESSAGQVTSPPEEKPELKPEFSPEVQPESNLEEGNEEGREGESGSGGGGVRDESEEDGNLLAGEVEGPQGDSAGEGGDGGNQSVSEGVAGGVSGGVKSERVPAKLDEVNKRISRFENFFRNKGQHRVADWMGRLREHINAIGGEEALRALGEGGSTVKPGDREKPVQYWGVGTEEDNWKNMGEFIEQYLSRNGIFAITAESSEPDMPLISALGKPDRYVAGQDFKPSSDAFKNKLDEAQHLPGLEKSQDIEKLLGRPVTHLTDDVMNELDNKYGKGQWIVKCYDDNAAAGYGIFFPQKAQKVKEDARNTIWQAGLELKKYGFELGRDPDTGEVFGVIHESGDIYQFDTPEFEKTIYGDARHWAERAKDSANHENGAMLPDGSFMVQPAFPAVGISDEERAAGKTWHATNEGRVHLVTREDGTVEVIPHSTWFKGGDLPVVFEDDHTRAMAKAAQDAINALPAEARRGQVYAPDVMKTADGYKVVELNAQGDTNGSGYLHDNGFTIDAYTSYLAGREPAHVAFIRQLLTKRKREKWLRYWVAKGLGLRRVGYTSPQEKRLVVKSKGTCKVGERSDLTGCVPASGTPGKKPSTSPNRGVKPVSRLKPARLTTEGPSKPADRHDVSPTAKRFKVPPVKRGIKGGGKPTRGKGEKSQTVIGDTVEELAKGLGFRSILPKGKRSHAPGEVRRKGSTIDVEYDHSGKAYEIKACLDTSTEYRLKAKKEEKVAKVKYAKKNKLTPYTMVAVVKTGTGEVSFYASKKPGLIGSEVNARDYDYVGSSKSNSLRFKGGLGLVTKAAGGKCEQGERADLTGCIPTSKPVNSLKPTQPGEAVSKRGSSLTGYVYDPDRRIKLLDLGIDPTDLSEVLGKDVGELSDPKTKKDLRLFRDLYSVLGKDDRKKLLGVFGLGDKDPGSYNSYNFYEELTRGLQAHVNGGPIKERLANSKELQDAVAKLAELRFPKEDRLLELMGEWQKLRDEMLSIKVPRRVGIPILASASLEAALQEAETSLREVRGKEKKELEGFISKGKDLLGRLLANKTEMKRVSQETERGGSYVSKVLGEHLSSRVKSPEVFEVEHGDDVPLLRRDAFNDGLMVLTGILEKGDDGKGLEKFKTYVAKTTDGKVDERAHYLPTKHMINFCGPGDGITVAVHEMMHGVEYRVRGVKEAVKEFRSYRVGDEKPTNLGKFSSSMRGEMGYKDEFDRALGDGSSAYYAGKVYSDGATEILSVGMEHLYSDPVGFAKKDPEYCAFLLGILDGTMRSKPIPEE